MAQATSTITRPDRWQMPSLAEIEAAQMPTVHDMKLQRIRQLLNAGHSVSLTAEGAVLCTMHPNGQTEYPDRPGRLI